MTGWLEMVEQYFELRNRAWVTLDTHGLFRVVSTSPTAKWCKHLHKAIIQKHRALQYQGKRLLRVHSVTRLLDVNETDSGESVKIIAEETIHWVYLQKHTLDVESRVILHKQQWVHHHGNWLLAISVESSERKQPSTSDDWTGADADAGAHGNAVPDQLRDPLPRRIAHTYNRVRATKYADLWWNGFNPKYQRFTDDDCTNFISQCVHVGGIPMHISRNAARGWWYQGNAESKNHTWSYSWSTSNSLYLFLTEGIGAKRLRTAKDLQMGDLVFYDWNGVGQFHHSTIITDYDEAGDPLVNAHTDASYHRAYAYLDSRAWTERTRYAFVHIPDRAD